jgi:microcystin degradation protein MlrC
MVGSPLRVAVASIIQETNTFSPRLSTLEDFRVQGLWVGPEAVELSRGTNTEFAGATAAVEAAGAVAVPIVRAWAMSDGILTAAALAELRRMLVGGLSAGRPVDGLVLCLHGALVSQDEPAADVALTRAARDHLGPSVPIVVTHDLHANVTDRIVSLADAVIGFRTYPHVDQGDTGRRGAQLILDLLCGGPRPATALAKRSMVVPAEGQALADPPMCRLRELADLATAGPIIDVSLFPVQPWLDVPELGFGVTVTHLDAPEAAQSVADRVADQAWQSRHCFEPTLVAVDDAVNSVAESCSGTTVLLVQSADSPTAGATADSAAVIASLLRHGRGISALATVVDSPAVALCFEAGMDGQVRTSLGATLDRRWSEPVLVEGVVRALGDSPVILTGRSMTGQQISMGRWASLEIGNLTVLVTERATPTFDPAGYRHAGLEPSKYDAVLVRSATLFRAGFAGLFDVAHILDLPGASTPNLRHLDFHRAPRPMFPLDGQG